MYAKDELMKKMFAVLKDKIKKKNK